MKRRIFFYIIFMLIHLSGLAQDTGNNAFSIEGKALDPEGKPVEFANVILHASADSSFVKGVVTDSSGRFIIYLGQTTKNKFFLSISFIGFKKYFSPEILLNETNPKINLGAISLISDEKVLQEVVVKGERPAVEKQLGKLIINVSNSFFNTSSNAFDVLNHSPGVIVDKDGGISIRGKNNPQLMIDGKPATNADVKSLSSADIEKIEIISNAGARYDAESKGVINVILKRDKTLGISGNANAEYEYKRFSQYGTGLSLTYKTPKIAYFGRGSYFSYKVQNDFILKRTTDLGVFDQVSSLIMDPHGYHFRVGADYFLSPRQTLGVLVRGFEHPYGTVNTGQAIVTETDRQYKINTLSNIDRTNQGLSYNLNYKGFLDEAKKGELVADLNYATFKNSGNQMLESRTFFQESSSGNLSSLQNVSRFSTTIKSFNIDYSKSITENTKFEVGTKNSWIKTENYLKIDTLANGLWINDELRSNEFIYNENIFAVYGMITQKIGKGKVEAGLRFEKTSTKGNSVTINKINERTYDRLLPSIQYEYNINEDNTLSFAYAMKLTRPSFEALNPFTLFIDKYTYIEGNPSLLPENVSSYELSFAHKDWSATLAYSRQTDIITQLPQRVGTGNTYKYTMLNLDKGEAYSLDFNLPLNLTSWWKIQGYFQLAYERYTSRYLTSTFDNERVSYYLKTSSVFKLPKGITFDLSFYYQSPSIAGFYRTKDVYELSGGFQKNVIKDRGSLSLTFSDILYSFRSYNIANYLDINLEQNQKRNTQGARLNFTYKFGKSVFKQKPKKISSSDEENRVGN